jgi:hypothetical protein
MIWGLVFTGVPNAGWVWNCAQFAFKISNHYCVNSKTNLMDIIFVSTNLTHNSFSYMFISILYMFLAVMCPSSGEFVLQFAHQTVACTGWHTPDVVLIQLILLMMGT